ncbi:DUF4190 domain-containing protein [Streptomyces sp. NPDC047928]|uniref:DUF4190 domain-containing protein n=1 Tax=unclassified Streptomyces TaxID=2593676 RepID=UPI0037231B19
MSSSPQGWPPPQQPYPPVPPPPGAGLPPSPNVNGLSIASLVAGIVCCVPPLGLILGAVALRQIKKKGERGKGLALTGVILSLISTLLVTIGVATGAADGLFDGLRRAKEEAASSRSPFALRTGQCFNTPGGDLTKEVFNVKVVDCAKPHQAEVTGGFKLTGFTEWPGEKPIEPIAEKRCDEISLRYAMDTWALPEDIWTYYYQPSEESWRGGDRVVTCAFAMEKGKLSTSLRSDATTLTAPQADFLTAVNGIDAALIAEPDADVDADFDANVAWAKEVSAALGAAVAGLEARQWTGASAKPVADLVKKLKAARQDWVKAADAADAETFWQHYDTGYDALPMDLGREARSALGLHDTPPEDGEPGGGESGGGAPGDGEPGEGPAGEGAPEGGTAV